MWAGHPNRVPGREFLDFDTDPRGVRAYGHTPVAVEVTEDPAGDYYGWIDAPDSPRPKGRGGDAPTMIQPHAGIFDMQFAYGAAVEVERRHGEIVRLSCRAVSETEVGK
jgi:hypothetical protein